MRRGYFFLWFTSNEAISGWLYTFYLLVEDHCSLQAACSPQLSLLLGFGNLSLPLLIHPFGLRAGKSPAPSSSPGFPCPQTFKNRLLVNKSSWNYPILNVPSDSCWAPEDTSHWSGHWDFDLEFGREIRFGDTDYPASLSRNNEWDYRPIGSRWGKEHQRQNLGWPPSTSGHEKKNTAVSRVKVLTLLSYDPDAPNNILPERCGNVILLWTGQSF